MAVQPFLGKEEEVKSKNSYTSVHSGMLYNSFDDSNGKLRKETDLVDTLIVFSLA